MRTDDKFTLLMSVEDAGNIDTGGGQSAPPAATPIEPAQPDSAAAIMSDLHQHFEQPEPAPQPAPAEQPATPDPAVAPTAPLPATAPDAAAASTAAPGTEAAAPPVEEVVPAPESFLAPIFSLATLPADEAIPQAIELVSNFAQYDPHAHKLLGNAVFQSMPNTFRNWVLEDMGVKPEQVDQFRGWLANGGPAAPALNAFPEPNADGWVTMPNGVQLDTSVPEEMERYETQKQLHEMRVEKQQMAAQRAADEERNTKGRAEQEAQNAYDRQMANATKYATERYAVRDQMINEAVKDLAPEDQLFGNMFRAYAKDHLDNHPEMLSSSKQAGPHVLAGDGRVPEFAKHQEAIIRREMNTLKQDFSLALLRLNRAEKAAIATAPHAVPGVKEISSVQPERPDEELPEHFDGLMDLAKAYDRQQVAQAQRRA